MRLDHALVERKLAPTRTKAQEMIAQGFIVLDGIVATKAHKEVSEDAHIEVIGTLPYVSRGGVKLAHALDHFHIDPRGLVCVDAGASTGGFTDCLLKRGAKKVYAIDVGTAQLDASLTRDPRVVSLEQTDIRNVTLPEIADMAVADLSFISLAHILPALEKLLRPQSIIVALVKPQFEVSKKELNKQGVVKDTEVRADVLTRILHAGDALGFTLVGATESPITGGAGNVEYLVSWKTKNTIN